MLIFFVIPAFAQDITGTWKGNIRINHIELPLVFHFFKTGSGETDGVWDSPQQQAFNLSFAHIRFTQDSLFTETTFPAASYRGKFIGKDSISGECIQGTASYPLGFLKSTADTGIQNIHAYPFEKEVGIAAHGGVTLYGSLVSRSKAQPVIILIAGSGPTDRDGNSSLLPQKINEYRQLAHALDSQHIATFRFDKRGVGKSLAPGMKESDLRFEDYIQDVETIFDFLHDSLGFRNIYIAGHSEGSLIGMIAAQKKKVKGYISISGAGRPAAAILEEQMLRQPYPDSLKKQITALFQTFQRGELAENLPAPLASVFRTSVQPYLLSWFKYSPAAEIKKLTCPVLIIQGNCDIQVPPADADSLHQAQKSSILQIIPGMSHVLKNAGAHCENQEKTYTDGSLPVDPLLVTGMAQFVPAKEQRR